MFPFTSFHYIKKIQVSTIFSGNNNYNFLSQIDVLFILKTF